MCVESQERKKSCLVFYVLPGSKATEALRSRSSERTFVRTYSNGSGCSSRVMSNCWTNNLFLFSTKCSGPSKIYFIFVVGCGAAVTASPLMCSTRVETYVRRDQHRDHRTNERTKDVPSQTLRGAAAAASCLLNDSCCCCSRGARDRGYTREQDCCRMAHRAEEGSN